MAMRIDRGALKWERVGTVGSSHTGPWNAHTSLFGPFSIALSVEPEIEANFDDRGDSKRQYNPYAPRVAIV